MSFSPLLSQMVSKKSAQIRKMLFSTSGAQFLLQTALLIKEKYAKCKGRYLGNFADVTITQNSFDIYKQILPFCGIRFNLFFLA
jgi:hypothetical protein